MEIRARLEAELAKTTARLQHLDGLLTVRDGGGVAPLADPMEEVRVAGDREIDFAMRSRLVERAHRLAEALELLETGEYGVCEECGQAIAPARLEWLPEVRTCVACQQRRERLEHVVVTDDGTDEVGEDEELL
jgi:DnaK suppressor protein